MFKKILGFLLLTVFLAACGSEAKEEKFYFFATSENWDAEMEATQYPPPEDNIDIHMKFIYTGEEQEIEQEITYEHTIEWKGDGPSIVSNSEYLPTEENPYQVQLADTGLLGGYEVGFKWITHIHWLEDGNEMTEELTFEEM
ncbi:hypothetical protein [Halalkalibacter alkaliphilus]|uniref:Lipoprotein n=1 Tax=Halalkalibacter alkaliphilus TaxID=2917993 RepID=A0A9X2IAP6_9BACI|nr:hypothetical protein [Halalkalibacter alkaliphilus]MCL7749590.1 hypothetical protein [Halalkalibacter alkaliphilus]